MPELGEIVEDKELGREGSHKHVWLACSDCGKEFWATWRYFKRRGYEVKCSSCRNRECALARSSLKGAKRKNGEGYIIVKLPRSDFFLRMADKRGCLPEHRLIMAKHLHRCLLP